MYPGAGLFKASVGFLGEVLLVGLALFAMDSLAHLRLGVGQFFVAWIGWGVILLGGRVMRRRFGLAAWVGVVAESATPGLLLAGLSPWGRGALTLPQAVYAIALVMVLVQGWRFWLARIEGRNGGGRGEAARVLIIGAAAFAATLPLFTDRLVGGTDARWYATMLGDYVAQLRAGVFPVFVGQGELAWNGGVHPFRSAPVYMQVAGLWDLLTVRAVGICALQHLAAITSAFAAGLGMYAAGVLLAPHRRWEAAGVALLYLAAPASLEALFHADAYMTWMALGALPLVLYGNARALLADDGRGFVAIASGLALTWMCHPPIALLISMATLLLQAGRFIGGPMERTRIAAAVRGAVLFVGLGAFYFYGMSEVPSTGHMLPLGDALQMGGLVLWLTGVAWAVVLRRGLGWLALLAPGGWMLWSSRTPWLWWMVVATVLMVVVVVFGKWRRWFDPAKHSIEILLPCLVVAAGLVQAWLGPANPARDVPRLQDLGVNTAYSVRYFLPLSPRVTQPGDWQPGLGLWMALVALGAMFFSSRHLGAKLWFAVIVLPVFTLVHVPWVSEFLVGYAPRWFAETAGLTFTLRLMPAMAALLAMGWMVWLSTFPENRKAPRWFVWIVLPLAVGFGMSEAAKVVRPAVRAVATRIRSEDQFRPENVVLEHFAYDLLPQPTYYSNGVTNPRLEVRAFDESRNIQSDPDVTARRMEQAGRTEMKLVCLPYEPPAPAWLRLGPALTVSPGEQLLLRFEFNPTKNYTGYLFMKSDRGYREYALPESGLRRAFGASELATHVISLWNTGVVDERYEFTFRRGAGCTLPVDGSVFADVFISHYDSARALVRVDSLLPYRATAELARPGTIETSRVWLPGYEANVDGHPVPVQSSPERLVSVPVPAGRHTVELRFVGTTGLWVTGWISALTWGGLIGAWTWRLTRKS